MANKHGAVRAALCKYLEKAYKPDILHTEYKLGDYCWPADVFVKEGPESREEIIEVETGYSPLVINEKGETQLEKKLRLAKSSGVKRLSFCLPYRWRNEAFGEIVEKKMEISSVYLFDEDKTGGITIAGPFPAKELKRGISPRSDKKYLSK